MPIVVPREAFERLQKWKDKDKNVNYNQPRHQEPKPRHLFLRYKKDGAIRVKRLDVRTQNSGNSWTDEIGGFRDSRVLKLRKRNTFILNLGQPEDLEQLLRQVLDHLDADPCKRLDYYWEDVE